MPDYFPQVQLPTGLAEEIARQISQRGQIWGQTAASLGNNVGDLIKGIRSPQNLPTAQANAIVPGTPAPSPTPGQPAAGPPSPAFNPGVFPRGVPPQAMSLVEQMQHNKELEAIARQKSVGTMDLEGLKAQHAKEIEEIKAQHAKELADIKAKNSAKAKSISSGIQVDKFVQGELDKYNRSINPANATRGSLLGLLGQNQARALRAIETAKDPNIVVQQLDNMTNDYAGIMQGGVPHESGIAQNRFSNILTKWSALKSEITSTPQPLNNPAVVKKVKQMINDIRKADNLALKDNLKVAKDMVSPTSKKYPEFKEAADKMEKDILDSNLMSEDGSNKQYHEMSDEELLSGK